MYLLVAPQARRMYRHELRSMHRLRHRVFIEQLGWPLGAIRSENGMETDQFDTEDAHYIVRLNQDGEVDASTRLLPTDRPYLLAEVFPQLVTEQPLPRSPDVWETSRFCADNRTAPKNILGQLSAAMIEFGLERGVSNIVSVSDVRIEPLARRAGWSPKRLGGTIETGTDTAVGLIYPVDGDALEQVRRKSGIPGPVLPSPPLLPSCPANQIAPAHDHAR